MMDRASTYIPIAQTNFTDYILEPIESTENASNKKRSIIFEHFKLHFEYLRLYRLYSNKYGS